VRKWIGLSAVALFAFWTAAYSVADAQAPRTDSEVAVTALVTEVRALRADLAVAAQRTLRTQILLGRVQMQEQRIAYLDRQRVDVSAKVMEASQGTAALKLRADQNCQSLQAEIGRQCELNRKELLTQVELAQNREQLLRNQETDMAAAVQTEQARWAEFNARLDEVERTIR
jgi:hypothetical protein